MFKPADDVTFETFRARYEYKRDALKVRVVERVGTPDWTREKIDYIVNGHPVLAYLYLPKSFKRPLKVIHFARPATPLAAT